MPRITKKPPCATVFVTQDKVNQQQTSDMNQIELFTARMENAAVEILESVLHRKRWIPHDRDSLAQYLKLLVTKELRRSKAK